MVHFGRFVSRLASPPCRLLRSLAQPADTECSRTGRT